MSNEQNIWAWFPRGKWLKTLVLWTPMVTECRLFSVDTPTCCKGHHARITTAITAIFPSGPLWSELAPTAGAKMSLPCNMPENSHSNLSELYHILSYHITVLDRQKLSLAVNLQPSWSKYNRCIYIQLTCSVGYLPEPHSYWWYRGCVSCCPLNGPGWFSTKGYHHGSGWPGAGPESHTLSPDSSFKVA